VKTRLRTSGEVDAALAVLYEKSPDEATVVSRALTEMNRLYGRTIANFEKWIAAFQSGFRRILQGETISKREELEKIANKDIESFEKACPFFFYFFFNFVRI
jgi:hypothetical protein